MRVTGGERESTRSRIGRVRDTCRIRKREMPKNVFVWSWSVGVRATPRIMMCCHLDAAAAAAAAAADQRMCSTRIFLPDMHAMQTDGLPDCLICRRIGWQQIYMNERENMNATTINVDLAILNG
jgi:hypothetical protein